MFNITNKIAFYNESELPASLVLAAVVFRLRESAAAEHPPPAASAAADEAASLLAN